MSMCYQAHSSDLVLLQSEGETINRRAVVLRGNDRSICMPYSLEREREREREREMREEGREREWERCTYIHTY